MSRRIYTVTATTRKRVLEQLRAGVYVARIATLTGVSTTHIRYLAASNGIEPAQVRDRERGDYWILKIKGRYRSPPAKLTKLQKHFRGIARGLRW